METEIGGSQRSSAPLKSGARVVTQVGYAKLVDLFDSFGLNLSLP